MMGIGRLAIFAELTVPIMYLVRKKAPTVKTVSACNHWSE